MKNRLFLALVAIVLVSLAIPVSAQNHFDRAWWDAKHSVLDPSREVQRNLAYGREYREHEYQGYHPPGTRGRSRNGISLTFFRGDGRETPGKCVERMSKAFKKAKQEVDPALIIAGCTGTNVPAPPSSQEYRASEAAQQTTGARPPGVYFDRTKQMILNNTDKVIKVFVGDVEVGVINPGKYSTFARISSAAGVAANADNIKFNF